MSYTLIKDVCLSTKDYIGKEIKLGGWVKTIRASNNFGFIELNDGSYFKNIQIVFENNLDNYSEIAKQNVGASIIVTGTLVETPQAKQPFEVKAVGICLEGASTPDFPLQKKRHSFEFLRTIAHLRPRTNTFNAVFRVRSEVAYAIHEFFHQKGFVYVHTPLITTSDCEGAGELFQVTSLDLSNVKKDEFGNVDYTEDFFGKKTGLSVSGQLAAETYAMAFRNVYTFGPTFRAEKSMTTRHAAEFWMIEPEMAFADLNDYLDLAEEMMKYIINHVFEALPEEMDFFNNFVDKGLIERLQNVANSDFERITYTQAIEILSKVKDRFEFPVHWGADIQTEHERYLCEVVYQKPVYLTDYPKEIKSFYMRLNDDGKTVAAADLLVPGIGEIIGGSQREERYDVLCQRLKDFELEENDYSWYLDTRKYGSCKHAGYGLGFERCIMYITGMTNIRDVSPFPRNFRSAEF